MFVLPRRGYAPLMFPFPRRGCAPLLLLLTQRGYEPLMFLLPLWGCSPVSFVLPRPGCARAPYVPFAKVGLHIVLRSFLLSGTARPSTFFPANIPRLRSHFLFFMRCCPISHLFQQGGQGLVSLRWSRARIFVRFTTSDKPHIYYVSGGTRPQFFIVSPRASLLLCFSATGQGPSFQMVHHGRVRIIYFEPHSHGPNSFVSPHGARPHF